MFLHCLDVFDNQLIVIFMFVWLLFLLKAVYVYTLMSDDLF